MGTMDLGTEDAWAAAAAANAPAQNAMQDTAQADDQWQHYTPVSRPAGFQQDRAQYDEFSGVTGTYDFGAGSGQTRIIDHDKPPEWDGLKPEVNARIYVKMLKIWLATTKTRTNQQGMCIWHATPGDLRAVIDDLDSEAIVAESAGQDFLQLISGI